VARSRDIFARWSALAEQRLDYLTELFETGRWRRYHSERAFLENIQEAKTAVEIWRDLATREASRDNTAIDMSWLGRRWGTPLPSSVILPDVTFPDRVHRLVPRPVPIEAEPVLPDVSVAAETGTVCSDEAPSAPDSDTSALEAAPELTTPNVPTIHERYPVLRNAM
jgi:uncharacterized repeat protein (TIGR03809 family)